MRHLTSCLLGASFFLASAAWADGAKGPQWDDSHMQSRHQETPPTNRPRISGESGYGALQSGEPASVDSGHALVVGFLDQGGRAAEGVWRQGLRHLARLVDSLRRHEQRPRAQPALGRLAL